MTTATTTELATLRMDCPLASTVHLKNMAEADLAVLGDAFPGEMSDDDRMRKARALVSQFRTYIDTIDNKTGARDKVLACVTQSIADCMLTMASLDLPLTKSLGYAALIPYGGICTVTIMYQGLGELMYRTGTIASVQTGVVYEGDKFDYELGSAPKLTYSRGDGPATNDTLTHAWCLIHNKVGPDSIEVMERSELDKVHRASKMPNGPAWKNWFSEMCRKAPMRRLAKTMQTAVGGIAQTTLAAALAHENAGYDLEHYQAIRQEHSKGLMDKVSASLGSPKSLPAPDTDEPPADTGISPKGKTKRDLLNHVKEMRKSCESSMTDGEYVQQVIFDMHKKQTIDTQAEFDSVWNEIVNTHNRDLETGEKFPPEEKDHG